ncbi:MAG: hypothetical protein ACJASV_003121 [Pseudorhodobacter sp.]|jgi:hypothetical protein
MRRDTAYIKKLNLKALLFSTVLGCLPLTALAETAPETDGKAEGLSLMERGMQLFFQELLNDMEPALDDMAKALKEFEPMARELAEMIGDVQNFEPPVQMPNGDILIRRKPGAPPLEKRPLEKPEGQIEL